MENENIMEELIEIQEPDEEHDSVSDMIENIGTDSPSKTSSKDENLEKELTSFDKDSCSASSLKERELSSEVTQDSVQISTKRYFESQQSNEDDCLSNATDSQYIKDDHSGSPMETYYDNEEGEQNPKSSSKVKSVIKLSPSMHSDIQESLGVDKSPQTESSELTSAFEEHVLPDCNGHFTFPEDRQKFDNKFIKPRNITKEQFLKRIKNDKVLVVSVFGRSARIDGSGDKAFIFDNLMQKDVFRFRLLEEPDSDSSYDSSDDNGLTISEASFQGSNKDEPFIEGYHDKTNKRIYLHLKGNFDSKIFARRCTTENLEDQDLHTFFSENKFAEAKLLLFLFHVSHLLVCYHETPYFDYTYVNLFQTLDSVRAKLHSSLGSEISKKFRKLGLPKDVINHGRFCIPKLVFYFATAPMGLRGSKGTAELIKRDGKVSKNPPIRKLEFSIEDQIYRIFRRVRLISSSSATSCLFSIPSRDGFVYVDNRENTGPSKHMSQNRDEMVDQLNYLFHDTLNQRVKGGFGDEVSSDTSDSENSLDAKCNGLTPGMPYNYQYIVSNEYGKTSNIWSKINYSKRSFSKFLLTHIDFLTKRAEKGSNDGDERRSVYELPTSIQWYYGASCIFRLIGPPTDKLGFGDEEVSSTTAFVRANSILESKTSIENRFSESRCAKALPNAITNYKEGLQSHYLYDYHQAKLLQAVTLFSHQSRGPASKKYAELLVEECTAYWQAGRQMCEELSLTGHHCTNRKHLVPTPSEILPEESNVSDTCPTSKPTSNSTISNQDTADENISKDDNIRHDVECSVFEKGLAALFDDMSSDNFEKTVAEFNKLEITNDEELDKCIEKLFESAIMKESELASCHAQLCEALKSKDLTSFNMRRTHVTKKIVIRCQQEFENSFKKLEELSHIDSSDGNMELTSKNCSDESNTYGNARKRAIAVIVYYGELYKLNILTKSIMHDCIRQLVQKVEVSNSKENAIDDTYLECLCKLLTRIGKELENDVIPKTKSLTMDRYFDEIMNILDSKSFSFRSRDMIQELLDLRHNNWIPSNESVAKKITGKINQGNDYNTSEISSSNAKKNLPTIPHRSSMTYISACNCGRRQVNRNDPFALVEANFMFYAELEDECCGDLEHIQVPYYREQQSSSNALDETISHPSLSAVFSGAALEKSADVAIATEAISKLDVTDKESIEKLDKIEQKLKPETEIKRQHDDNGDHIDNKQEKSNEDKSTITINEGIIDINNERSDKLQILMNRQTSLNDSVPYSSQYSSIPHMITTNTEAGKLPLFSSWALTQLGSSSVYAHSSGVNQPGFVSNTRNLLPWDVPLKDTDWHTLQRKWPNIAESAIKKSSFNPAGKGADMGLTVKVFIGLEYECPRGHRIIASSPGKTKSMTSSITNRMVNSDSPLYQECQCSKGTSHPVVSQLMRIHIVTPKAPMHITLNPRVIPCPDGPTFHPGWNSPQLNQVPSEDKILMSSSNLIKLPISTYWVLRLPFIYWGEGGSHLPPKDIPEANYGRLLKGFIGVTEDYTYKL